MSNILETALKAGNFKTLAAAVASAGLTDTLNGAGPFTVFAPTDEAFAKLPKEKLDALFADKKRFSGVLTYHVAAGKLLTSDLAAVKDLKSLQGATLKVDAGNGLSVNGNKVIKADVAADNGVIHVVDTVLMPS